MQALDGQPIATIRYPTSTSSSGMSSAKCYFAICFSFRYATRQPHSKIAVTEITPPAKKCPGIAYDSTTISSCWPATVRKSWATAV